MSDNLFIVISSLLTSWRVNTALQIIAARKVIHYQMRNIIKLTSWREGTSSAINGAF